MAPTVLLLLVDEPKSPLDNCGDEACCVDGAVECISAGVLGPEDEAFWFGSQGPKVCVAAPGDAKRFFTRNERTADS